MYQRFCTLVSLGETTQKIASKKMQTLAHTRLKRQQLQRGKSYDQMQVQGEHLTYVISTLTPILAHMFDRALIKELHTTWTFTHDCAHSKGQPPTRELSDLP